MIMTIKKLIIGSDDDGPLTKTELHNLSGIRNYGERSPLRVIKDIEHDERDTRTARLEPFHDDEYYKPAYDEGFVTYMSIDSKGESNEIVYLVKEHI